MDRNLWLAVALSIAVYAAWFGLVERPQQKAVAGVAAEKAATAPTDVSTVQQAKAPVAPAAGAAAAPPDVKKVLESADPVQLGEAEARVGVRGAGLVSYRYPGPLGLVELVHSPVPGLFAAFGDLEFSRDRSVKTGLSYVANRPDGLRVIKQYIPGHGTVLPRLRVTAINTTRRPIEAGGWALTVGPGLSTVDSEKSDNESVWRAIALTPPEGGKKGRIQDLDPEDGPFTGSFRWIGIDNRYFLAAILPSAAHFEPVVAAVKPAPALTLTAKPVTLAPGASQPWEIPYYLGPKGYTWLARYDIGLERSVDFGFFNQLGRWLLWSLEYLHRSVGNWGWAIIILTLALQVLLFPLTYKSLKAAAAMRKLAPEVARIQAKYKDDAARLSQETMALYKRSGANPLGGCLPMLMQMPIFIALYNALRNSWELHGADWLLWITDLSAKDPYYVLPLVMGGLMFLQTKLSPPAADPAQQQMMLFMPVIFTFMFLNFPSGLVLYWLTNSLVSAVLQVGLQKHFDKTA